MNEPVLGYFGGDTLPLGGPVQMHPKHIFVFFTPGAAMEEKIHEL